MLSSPGARVPLYADGQWLGKQDLLTNRQQCEATQQLVLIHPRLVTLAQDQQMFVGNGVGVGGGIPLAESHLRGLVVQSDKRGGPLLQQIL